MFRRKRKYKYIDELLEIVTECQDRSLHTNLERTCKEILRNMTQQELNLDEISVLRVILEEARQQIRMNHFSTATICLERVLQLCADNQSGRTVGNHMGIFNRIKEKKEQRESKSQKAILEKEEREAEQRIFEIEKKIALLYDNHSDLMSQFEEKVKACSHENKESNQYRYIRQQAQALVPRLRSIEKQIAMHAKMLENSSRYQAMIQMGKSTFDLKQFMPDVSKAEAMMQWISEETQELSETMNGLSSEMDVYEKELETASDGDAFKNSDFDDLVSKELGKQHEDQIRDDSGVNTAIESGANNTQFVDSENETEHELGEGVLS